MSAERFADAETDQKRLAVRRMNARDAFGAVWRQIEQDAEVDFFLGGDWMNAWLSAAGGALDM